MPKSIMSKFWSIIDSSLMATLTLGNEFSCINTVFFYVPYRGKLWRVESLADLANYNEFAKVSSTKLRTLFDFK